MLRKNFSDVSKQYLEESINSTDVELATKFLLYAVFNTDDFDWIENICLTLMDNKNKNIAGLAITSLGHLARMYKKIDVKALEKLKNVTDIDLIGRAEDALDDIDIFVKNHK